MLSRKKMRGGRAVLRVTYELLGYLLQLPHGHRVVDVFQDHMEVWSTHSFHITVRGPKMPPVGEGEKMSRINLSATADGEIDWDNIEFTNDL